MKEEERQASSVVCVLACLGLGKEGGDERRETQVGEGEQKQRTAMTLKKEKKLT